MKIKILTLFFLFEMSFMFSQDVNPFYIGHSLINFDLPAMVDGLALNAGKNSAYGQQIINGAPLKFNYDNHATAEGTSFKTAFPNGGYNALVVTEGIPLQGNITFNDTNKYAVDFYSFAKDNNNAIPVKYYIYETWHCTTTGTPTGCSYDNNDDLAWQPRLQSDLPLWTGILNHVKTQFPNDAINMVPAGQAFYKLTSRINAGTLPGITSFTDLFRDDIHLTNKGNYFVACVMYATLFKQSPVGLTTVLNNRFETPFTDMPTSEQALVMQEVAWQTVTELSALTGVSSSLSVDNFQDQKDTIFAYPNPVSNKLFVDYDTKENCNYEILDVNGKIVLKGQLNNSKSISLDKLQKGFYFMKIGSDNSVKTQKIVKI
jgi:Secretion system C-terminal sorting domain